MKSLVFWGVAPAILAAVCGSASSARADQYKVVAQVGHSAEGTALAASNFYRLCNYSGAEPPVISGSGRIAFRSELLGGGLTFSNNAAVFCADPSATAGGHDSLRLLAQMGSAFQSTTSGLRLTSFSGLQISNNGRVGFQGMLSGTGVTSANGKTYWSFDGRDVSLIAREGTNLGGNTFGAVSELIVEGSSPDAASAPPSGDLVSFKSLVPGYAGVYSYYMLDSGGTEAVATVNATAPGSGGALFGTSLRKIAGGAGQYLLYTNLTGTGVSSANNSAIYLGSPNGLVLACRTGDRDIGITGASFTSLFDSRTPPSVNAHGKAAFTAQYSGTSSGSGVWRTQGAGATNRTLLVKVGDQASGPGIVGGTTFATMSPVGTTQNLSLGNDASDSVALVAGLAGPGTDATNDRSLWLLRTPTNRAMVARGGQMVEPGMTLLNESIGSTVRVNSMGQVAMRAQLVTDASTGATVYAILRYSGNTLNVVAREGQIIPGETPRYLRSVRWAPGLQFNDLGQIAFVGTVGDNEGDISGRPALLRIDENGNLAVVATAGLRFANTAGEWMTLSTPTFSDSASLSNDGQLTFVSTLITGANIDHALFRVSIEAERIAPPPPPRDPADFNASGDVTQDDLFMFLQAYFAGSLSADMNASNHISVEDLFVFLQGWFASNR